MEVPLFKKGVRSLELYWEFTQLFYKSDITQKMQLLRYQIFPVNFLNHLVSSHIFIRIIEWTEKSFLLSSYFEQWWMVHISYIHRIHIIVKPIFNKFCLIFFVFLHRNYANVERKDWSTEEERQGWQFPVLQCAKQHLLHRSCHPVGHCCSWLTSTQQRIITLLRDQKTAKEAWPDRSFRTLPLTAVMHDPLAIKQKKEGLKRRNKSKLFIVHFLFFGRIN